MSAKGEELVKFFEQLRLKAYMPTPNDVPTIGYGSTRGVKMGDVWTRERAEKEFAREYKEFRSKTAALFPGASDQQVDALTSLAYNIGLAGLAGSTVRKRHLAGRYNEAADAFLMWNKQAGKPLNGLTKRRKAERHLYLTGQLVLPK